MSSENNNTMPERDHEHERLVSIALSIPFQQARLVSLLSKGVVASTQEIANYMDSKTSPKVIAAYARREMRPFGIEIRSKKNVGYWIDAADCDKLAKLLKDYMDKR